TNKIMSTDIQRIQDINAKNYYDAITATQKQCKLIKNKTKAWTRYVFAQQIGGKKMNIVARNFFDKAVELGHERAIAFKVVFDWRRKHRYELKLARKRLLLYPVLEKFVKIVEKRVNIKCKISTLCGYPYWNDDGLFVSFDFLGDDAPYSGYNTSGAEHIGNYRRSYLGKNLSKIATITKKFECGLYKNSNNLFVKFPFPNPI
ncbi:MAG: hypothetical protein ACC656_00195, partial [Candidatus Heimdallarchaeota archaeon]